MTNELPWFKKYAEKCRAKGTNRIILDRESNEPYLERFYTVPRWVTLGMARVVIHRFWKGDTDSAWHDHPWPFFSLILEGGYWENRPDKNGNNVRSWRGVGSWALRGAKSLHYVEMDEKHKEVWTMFIMLTPAFRTWGFRSFDFKTWTPWQEYLAKRERSAALKNGLKSNDESKVA